MRTFSAILATRDGNTECGHNHLTPTTASNCGKKNDVVLSVAASDGKPITDADWLLTTADVRAANFNEWVEDIKEYYAEEQRVAKKRKAAPHA